MCAHILTCMLSLLKKDETVRGPPGFLVRVGASNRCDGYNVLVQDPSEEVNLIVESLLVVLLRTLLEITNRPQPAAPTLRPQVQDVTVRESDSRSEKMR